MEPAAKYPGREPFFAIQFIRLLTKRAAAQEIGSDGFCLLTVIVGTEDARRYSGGVTFYNGQLLALCGLSSERALIRVRERCVAAGWLRYEPGAKRRPGLYWVAVPDGEPLEDGPVDEGHTGGFPAESASANDSESASESDREIASISDGELSSLSKAPVQPQCIRRESASPPILFPNPNTEDPLNPPRGETLGAPDSQNHDIANGRKPRMRPERFDPLTVAFPSELQTAAFRAAWKEFTEHRAEKRKPITKGSADKLIAKCARVGSAAAVTALEDAIAGGWTGVFPKSEDTKPAASRRGAVATGPGQIFHANGKAAVDDSF